MPIPDTRRLQDAVLSESMARNFVFPDPNERTMNHPGVICHAERILALFNQESGDSAQRISKKVRAWFEEEAIDHGWGSIEWYPEASGNQGMGCVLKITVSSTPIETTPSQ